MFALFCLALLGASCEDCAIGKIIATDAYSEAIWAHLMHRDVY